MASSAALFVTLEGIEGAGKTTQMQRLSGFLESAGVDHVTTREPGGSALGEAIRPLLLQSGTRDWPPLVDLLLYNAARVQHLAQVVEPALAADQTVLCDRYKDATMAYQGHAGGLPLEVVEAVHRLPGLERQPDLTLLLDLPEEMGLGRARARQSRSQDGMARFEELELSFHQKVRQGYLALARSSPERIVIVDARGEPQEVFERIRPVLAHRLGLES